jgi:hypothetical protein
VTKLRIQSMNVQQFLLAKTAGDKAKSLRDKPISEWGAEFTKNWDPKRDFAYAMLHSERLIKLLIHEAIAEILLAQAKRDPERREILERYLDLVRGQEPPSGGRDHHQRRALSRAAQRAQERRGRGKRADDAGSDQTRSCAAPRSRRAGPRGGAGRGQEAEGHLGHAWPGGPVSRSEPFRRPREGLRATRARRSGAYKRELPPHLFPQWSFPAVLRALEGVPYPFARIVNAGCTLSIEGPLPKGEPLDVTARLSTIDDNGRRAIMHVERDHQHEELRHRAACGLPRARPVGRR